MTTAALTPIWVTARAAGIAALLAASLSASVGLISAMRPRWTRGRRIEVGAAHEALALATIALIVVHGLALLIDPYLRPGLAGVLVPFAAHYHAFAVGLGQVAAYGVLAFGLSYYVRKQLGAQRWRAAHRVIPVFWVLAVGHGLLSGTDAAQWWFLTAAALPVVSVGALLYARYADQLASSPRA